MALNLGSPRDFPFIERPSHQVLDHAMARLEQYQAITNGQLTPLGAVLSSLPVDIPIGKILTLASIFDVVEPILTIAAGLSVQSPFVRVTGEDDNILASREKLMSDHGDPFALLNIFEAWIHTKTHTKQSSRKWAKEHGLEEQRLYEIAKLRDQLRMLLTDGGLLEGAQNTDEDADSRMDRLNKANPFEAVEKRERNRDRESNKEKDDKREKRRQLRKVMQERAKRRGRRLLSLDEEEAIEDIEEIDLRNADFMLSHNIQDLMDATNKTLSVYEMNLIKIILCAGLYPNVAVSDEFNSSHKESEQAFHTKYKQFASLHPTSSLASRTSLIVAHDALFYVSLLHTQKPYLTNLLRAPALHSMLICANNIDTNSHCTVIIVDEWLMITVSNGAIGEKIMIIVSQLRAMLTSSLHSRLTSRTPGFKKEVDTKEKLAPWEGTNIFVPEFMRKIWKDTSSPDFSCSELELSAKLAEFLEWPVQYKFEKVKQSEKANIYGLDTAVPEEKEEGGGGVPKEQKGGIQITSYLRYASIKDENFVPAGVSKHMKKHWECDICKNTFIFNLDEILEHRKMCGAKPHDESINYLAQEEKLHEKEQEKEKEETETKTSNTARTRYLCEECDKFYLFTPPEILKHKKTHL